MKTLNFLPLFILVIISVVGCGVPQGEYEELKDKYDKLVIDNERLKTTLEEQSIEISSIEQELFNYKEKERKQEQQERKEVERQSFKPYISEAEAIEYLDQDYAFYNRGNVYKDLKVLRVGPNEFKFSMREGPARFKDNDFFYVDQVKTLTVFEDGKYKLTQW